MANSYARLPFDGGRRVRPDSLSDNRRGKLSVMDSVRSVNRRTGNVPAFGAPVRRAERLIIGLSAALTLFMAILLVVT